LGLREIGEEFKLYLRLTRGNTIARRYFIMNSFDGIVTIMGVITGSIVSGIINPLIIIGIGLSTALAMGMSGIAGTFIAEKTERDIEIRNLEDSLLSDLKNTVYSRAIKFTILYVSIVAAVPPIIAALIILFPLFLSTLNMIPSVTAIYVSLATALLYLFIMGSLLSKITKKNILLEGLKMMMIGVLTAILIILLFGMPG
jgi:predicted membrane protein (TIGR00267 family)